MSDKTIGGLIGATVGGALGTGAMAVSLFKGGPKEAAPLVIGAFTLVGGVLGRTFGHAAHKGMTLFSHHVPIGDGHHRHRHQPLFLSEFRLR